MSNYNMPFGSEFSPSQIELPTLLELCKANSGGSADLQASILNRYFSGHGRGDQDNKNKLAMNCRLGLKAYGVIDSDGKITDLGDRLYSLRADEDKLYAEFAKHILINLNGMSFIQCIRDMNIAGEKVTLENLRPACESHGIYYPSGGKHPSIMRLWLEKAGIFKGGKWVIDEDRIKQVLGTDDTLEILRGLTRYQRYFLMALLNTGVTDFQPANEIAKLTSATYDIRTPEKSLPKVVLLGLRDAGLIEIEKTTEGRGAKPFLVKPTDKVSREITIPFLEQLKSQVDPKLVELLRKPLSDIIEELNSDDRYISGLALEALAFKLMRLIDLDYVKTRLRGEQTGGAEVDLIFESDRLVFSKWQIQCKNTAHVPLDDIAKEVGLVQLLQSNVIVIVTTGKISTDARKYSNVVMKQTNLCIVMLDGDDIRAIATNPISIIDILNREAKTTKLLKKLDIN